MDNYNSTRKYTNDPYSYLNSIAHNNNNGGWSRLPKDERYVIFSRMSKNTQTGGQTSYAPSQNQKN